MHLPRDFRARHVHVGSSNPGGQRGHGDCRPEAKRRKRQEVPGPSGPWWRLERSRFLGAKRKDVGFGLGRVFQTNWKRFSLLTD